MMHKDLKNDIRRLLFVWLLLKRYWEGNATRQERELIERWEPRTRPAGVSKLGRRLADKLDRDVYTRLAERLGFTLADEELEAMKKRLQSNEKHGTRKGRMATLGRAAAAVTVLLMLGMGGWILTREIVSPASLPLMTVSDSREQWTTTNGQMMRLRLPDGTRVQVNAGSRMRIDREAFGRERREVWLEGEAFFDVTRDTLRPFVIHAGATRTIVRGTSFNVKAYPHLGEEVISVRSGRVDVRDSVRLLAMLSPDEELLRVTLTGKTEICRTDGAQASAWTGGGLVLHRATAEELRMRLRQHFGVEVLFREGALAQARLTVSFEPRTSLEEVAATIGELYDVSYDVHVDEKKIVFYK